MAVIERLTQKIFPGKWDALEAIDKKYTAVENRLGWPAKKRYRCMIGGHDVSTLVVERQWPSLAVFEAAYDKAWADPAWQALSAESDGIIASTQMELFAPLP